MKKNIALSIFIVLITFTFNIYTVNANDELKIDHDSLKSSENDAYMSVLDIYGVELFTDKVAKTKQEVKTQQEQNVETLKNGLFLSTDDAKSIRDKKFSEKLDTYNLFAQSKIAKKIKYAKDGSSINIVNISIIIFLCILTAVLTRLYYIHKRKGEEKRGEYNNYTEF